MKRIAPPDIDPRDTETVARQTAALARLSGWSPGDKADAGKALIGAFATMARQVITRLNQMPNRHFLAYLRMLGLQPRPPRAAEVPLTFTPTAGTQGVRIPAGTQVRGQHPDGTRATFHTNDVLELLPSRNQVPQRAITYQPHSYRSPVNDGIDRVSINTAMATGAEPDYYGLFTAADEVEHAVYLAADEVLTAADATVQVSITFASSKDAKRWERLQEQPDAERNPFVVWQYFSSVTDGWRPLAVDAGSVPPSENAFQFDFNLPADMATCALSVAPDTTRACWIRAHLTAWPLEAIPAWCGVTISAMDAVEVPASAPRQTLFNGVSIDTSKDYYPLGQQPVFNDACTLVLDALPSTADTTLAVHVTISEEVGNEGPDPCGSDNPTLVWEIGSGDTWKEMGSFGKVRSDVGKLKASGTVTLPAGAPGTDSPALRIRLASGNYGTGITVSTDPATGDTTVVDDGYRPPILHGITISAAYTPSATPVCVTDNGEGRRLEDFARPVTPFQLRADKRPAFYLAFGEPLGQATVSMYLEVSPLSKVTRSDVQAAKQGDADPAQVEWQYPVDSIDPAGNTDWKTLEVEDGTHAFVQSGFLRFIAPPDHARSAQFGSVPLYWLRARWKSGGYAVPPQGGLVLPNSVAASNARTIHGEVLGSSRQTPGQTFALAHTPILADPELIVREPTPPSESESAQLRAQFGPLAVVPASARPGADEAEDVVDLDAAWVRWKQVGSFAASGPQDRHYTLDSRDGAITFGDGRNGMAPPAGKNNIVMQDYRSGGGATGNLPAGAIDQLVTAVAHVAAVDNAIASSGGADGEDNAAVMDWGPRVLRHRGRATARQDYEDLARQGFPQLAKVRAITPGFDPTREAGSAQGAGGVLVIVVPDDDNDPPAPSLGLLQQVGDYLRARMPPAVQLRLSGPDWMVVNVKVTVVAKRMDRAGALGDEIGRALHRFLDPLSGGFDHAGWALGQMVHDSDVLRHLLTLPGVDSVSELEVTRAPAVPALEGLHATSSGMDERTADQHLTVILVRSGSHAVTVKPAGSA